MKEVFPSDRDGARRLRDVLSCDVARKVRGKYRRIHGCFARAQGSSLPMPSIGVDTPEQIMIDAFLTFIGCRLFLVVGELESIHLQERSRRTLANWRLVFCSGWRNAPHALEVVA